MKSLVVLLAAFIILLSQLSYFTEASSYEGNKKVPAKIFSPFYLKLLEEIKKSLYEKLVEMSPPKKSTLQMSYGGNYKENNTIDEKKEHAINDGSIFNWTFMIYIDGDNNLCNYASKKLNELLKIRKNGFAIIILYDGDKYNDSCIYSITDSVKRINQSEVNMGSGITLKNLISFAKSNYSAKHYFLEIWGHGNGWMGVAFDKTNRDYLTLKEIKNAINEVDIVSFSACYMGSIEVAYSLKSKVNYFIAPEGAMLANGLPYERIFERLNFSANPENVARIIVEEYADYYAHTSTNFAAWNMSNITELVTLINNFSSSINKSLIKQARNASSISPKYVDLYKFARFFDNEIAKEVMKAINGTIIAKFGNMHGIEIYCPLPQYYSNSYSYTDFSLDTNWDELL